MNLSEIVSRNLDNMKKYEIKYPDYSSIKNTSQSEVFNPNSSHLEKTQKLKKKRKENFSNSLRPERKIKTRVIFSLSLE